MRVGRPRGLRGDREGPGSRMCGAGAPNASGGPTGDGEEGVDGVHRGLECDGCTDDGAVRR
eukprot:13630674-Heterocapsa_arctica.AAC.1